MALVRVAITEVVATNVATTEPLLAGGSVGAIPRVIENGVAFLTALPEASKAFSVAALTEPLCVSDGGVGVAFRERVAVAVAVLPLVAACCATAAGEGAVMEGAIPSPTARCSGVGEVAMAARESWSIVWLTRGIPYRSPFPPSLRSLAVASVVVAMAALS